MRNRRSRAPFAETTSENRSSVIEIARSPIACMQICWPALSASISRDRMPSSGCISSASRPYAFGSSVYGAKKKAVVDPSDPSANALTAPVRRNGVAIGFAAPRPASSTHVVSRGATRILVVSLPCSACGRIHLDVCDCRAHVLDARDAERCHVLEGSLERAKAPFGRRVRNDPGDVRLSPRP